MSSPRIRCTSPERRLAFTLVELLVVVAIIALLLAILLPAMDKARLLARDVVCRSQLRQVGLSVAFYQAENEDRYPNDQITGGTFVRFGKDVDSSAHPVISRRNSTTETTYGLPVKFDELGYIKTNKVYQCPGQGVVPPAPGSSTYGEFRMNDWGNAYAVNVLSGQYGIAGKKGAEVMNAWRRDSSGEANVRARWFVLYDNWRTYPGPQNVLGQSGSGVLSGKTWWAAIPHKITSDELRYGQDLQYQLATGAFQAGGYNLIWPDMSAERMEDLLP